MFQILTTCFNAAQYIEHCLSSIQAQENKDWRCFVLDDLSTDNSVEIVKRIAEDDPRIILIENKDKHYQVGNYAQIMRREDIDDEDICLTVDGDDWLPDSGVLDRLEHAYANGAWMTYGGFVQWDGVGYDMGFAAPPPLWNKLRELRYTTTHLRTWKAFLWRQIKEKDLKRDDGSPIKAGGDTAFMYPMLEMCGPYLSLFVPYVNYVYNVQTPDNVYKHSLKEQHDTANEIRKRKPYEPYRKVLDK